MNALVYVDIDQRGFYIYKEKSQIVGYEKNEHFVERKPLISDKLFNSPIDSIV